MQRQRSELVPIGDAFSGMGGPMKAIREATPQARHHFTLANQVHQLVSGPVKRTPIWVSWRGSPLLTFLPSLAAVLLLAAGSLPLQAQGSTTYYFPHLAVGASWQTTITYINYSPDEVTCQTDFISDHGSPLMVSFAGLGTVVSRTDVLPPGGSVHQETNVDLSAPLAPGWARATCSGPVKASLLFRQHNSAGVPIAEGGVNAAAVPATRFVTFAEQAEGKAGTGVAYANPSFTAAHVTFTAKDAAGQTLASIDRTLLPNGHDAQNLASLFGPSSFIGSLEVTSTVPIVSLSLNFEAAPVFSSLPPGEVTPETPSEPSTTGLNTSLADPNGQWTATAAAKIIEKNIVYWEFSFFVDMTNRTNEEQEYPVKMHFMDADGFSVYESYAGDAFNKIPARSTRRLLGRALINPGNAPTVVGIRLEVRVR